MRVFNSVMTHEPVTGTLTSELSQLERKKQILKKQVLSIKATWRIEASGS
jgi:hypothetical protein